MPAMTGTISEAARAIVKMPPRITIAVTAVSTSPVIHPGTPKLAVIDWATEFDCTDDPVPSAATMPQTANAPARRFMPSPRSM